MINLALIGLGPMGKNYLNTAHNLKGVSIKYICSRDDAKLDNFSKKYVKLNDYKKLADYPLEGIIIATPASTHFQIAAFFLKKGIPLLIEKPLTNNLNEAFGLLKLQKKTPVVVGHTLLYHKAYLKIKNQLKSVGQIKSLEFIGANNSPRGDTSVMFDWGSHGIALFLDLLEQDPVGSMVTKVNNNNGLVSSVDATLNFPDNINAYLKVSWESKSKKRRLTIKGSKKTLIFDDIVHPFKPLSLQLLDFKSAIEGNDARSDLKFGVRVIKVLDSLNEHLE